MTEHKSSRELKDSEKVGRKINCLLIKTQKFCNFKHHHHMQFQLLQKTRTQLHKETLRTGLRSAGASLSLQSF